MSNLAFKFKRYFIKQNPYKMLDEIYPTLSPRYKHQVKEMQKCKASMDLHKKQNRHLRNRVEKKAYNAIYDEIYHHTFLFVYALKASTIKDTANHAQVREELAIELNTTKELVRKLSELDNLYIEINTTSGLNGTEKVDDIIRSLKEL